MTDYPSTVQEIVNPENLLIAAGELFTSTDTNRIKALLIAIRLCVLAHRLEIPASTLDDVAVVLRDEQEKHILAIQMTLNKTLDALRP